MDGEKKVWRRTAEEEEKDGREQVEQAEEAEQNRRKSSAGAAQSVLTLVAIGRHPQKVNQSWQGEKDEGRNRFHSMLRRETRRA